MLAQQRGIGVDEAFERLRAYCRRNNLPLVATAEAVIADPDKFSDLVSATS